MRVSVEKKFDLSKIRLDLSKQINMFADSVILDHKKRLSNGQDIHEKPFKKLSPSTIHSKRNKNLPKPRTPLYGEGIMLNVYSVKKATRSNQENIIIPPKKRSKVAAYHQQGTGPYTIRPRTSRYLGPLFSSSGQKYFAREVNHPGLSKREWFGITKTQEKKGLQLIELAIERLLRRG